eukprot:m.437294 g.437294  ORF g.437294 m.437294 type:complete len:77 (+) comp18093_c0_seq1:2459-2689(+)
MAQAGVQLQVRHRQPAAQPTPQWAGSPSQQLSTGRNCRHDKITGCRRFCVQNDDVVFLFFKFATRVKDCLTAASTS